MGCVGDLYICMSVCCVSYACPSKGEGVYMFVRTLNYMESGHLKRQGSMASMEKVHGIRT